MEDFKCRVCGGRAYRHVHLYIEQVIAITCKRRVDVKIEHCDPLGVKYNHGDVYACDSCSTLFLDLEKFMDVGPYHG